MKNLLLSLIFSSLCFSTMAQFAVINDPDGYTNLRKSPDSKSAILTQIKEGEVFYVYEFDEEDANSWMLVHFSRGEATFEGYLHQSRVRTFESFSLLKKVELTPRLYAYTDGETVFQVKTGHFDPAAHYLEREGVAVMKIDGMVPRGTDGNVPREEIRWMTLIDREERYEIPKKVFAHYYEPNFSYLRVYKGPDQRLYVSMLNSDGGGAYVAAMVFEKGKLVYQTDLLPY